MGSDAGTGTGSEGVSGAVPDAVPNTVPDAVSNAAPHAVPDAVPNAVSNAVPKVRAQVGCGADQDIAPRRGWNPRTPLTAAICTVAVVMVAHNTVVSAFTLGFAIVLALATRLLSPGQGRRQVHALGASAILVVPAGLSYALIYVPFAEDGWTAAGILSLRFAAMTASGLVLLSFIDADALMRDLQLRIPAPLVYMVGSVVRLLPMARQQWRTIRQIQHSRGVPDSWRARLSGVLPLVVGLVVDAGHRSRPLQRTGIGDPGPRTVLVPVNDSTAQRLLRWLMIAVVVGVLVAGVAL